MRICRIAEQFPPEPSGLGPGILELSLEQRRRGHELLVLARAAPGAEAFDARLPFPVVRLGGRTQMLFGLRAARVLLALQDVPEIVHIHGVGGLPYLLVPARLRTPAVATVHSLRYVQYPLMRVLEDVVRPVQSILGDMAVPQGRSFSALRPKVLQEQLCEKLICTRATRLALVAEHMAPAVRRAFGVRDGWSVVGNGASVADSGVSRGEQRLVRRWLGCGTQDRIVLFVGRLTWLKRPHLPILALPRLVREPRPVRYVCVGGGPLERVMQRLAARLGVAGLVRLIPWVPAERVRAFYGVADCLCLPSLYEGMPKVVLDAMAAGVPVVASDIPAHRDLLEEGRLGTLVREPSGISWAAGIRSALVGGPARARAAAAKLRVEQRHRWSHVAERLDGVYEAALQAAVSVPAPSARIT